MSKSMYGAAPELASGEEQTDWTRKLAPLGPGRLKVIIDVSNKCNLRCRMCHFSFDHVFLRPAQMMRPEMFERIAASVLPNAHTLVLSAGNEPLMSPWFIEILRLMAPYRIPEVYFLTNAQLLTEKVAEAVIETGVTQVQISADGATKETYEDIRRGARFETLLRNLQYLTNRKRALGRSRPQLQFNVVLMRRNLEELEQYVDLAERVGVEWIAARHLLQVTGLGMEQESLTHDRQRANHYFKRFLRRADESKTVTVVSFPDLFDGEQLSPLERSMTSDPGVPSTAPASVAEPQDVAPDKTPLTQNGSSSRVLAAISRKIRRPMPQRIAREIWRIPRNVGRLLRHGPAEPRSAGPKRNPLLPRGAIDFPSAQQLRINNAVLLQGWTSDQQQVRRVTIERDPFPADPAESINSRGWVAVGEAKILSGARPNPPGTFQRFPHRIRAGWEFQLRREMIPADDSFEVTIHVVAENLRGFCAEIGHRSVAYAHDCSAAPYLFCSKPFDSVLIDSRGDVSPYPDCRVPAPYGSFRDPGTSLSDIWYGKEFSELRRRIIQRDPPPMCLTCAYFINSNVDDSAYFVPR